MNRATAKFMAWRFLILSGPESMQSINRTRETVLLRNGYPPKTISRFMYTTAVLNVLVLPFAIFGGSFLTAYLGFSPSIHQNAFPRTGNLTALQIVLSLAGVMVTIAAGFAVFRVSVKPTLMTERIRNDRCAACDGTTTQHETDSNRTELRCTKCNALWIR